MSLGRWWGVYLRLHIFFVLFAMFTIFFAWTERTRQPDIAWIAFASLGILFVSVLMHELAHYFAAIRYGGDAEELVLGPLGGLAPIQAPLEPPAECLTHLAGPFVNLMICFVAGTVLWFVAPTELRGLLSPLAPQILQDNQVNWIVGFKLIFWINWVLLLANLLPAFPFDGGRALRAGMSAMWPDSSPRRAAFIVATVAKIAAAGLIVVAWLVRDYKPELPVPIWFSLAILAVFLYFGAKQEEQRSTDFDMEDELFGYDFSQGYTSLERSSQRGEPRASPFADWLERRRATKLQRQRELEEEEERRADEILARLHEKGMESLSDEERMLLKRVSARYRQRNSNQG
jgi:Zn-dependent protease